MDKSELPVAYLVREWLLENASTLKQFSRNIIGKAINEDVDQISAELSHMRKCGAIAIVGQEPPSNRGGVGSYIYKICDVSILETQHHNTKPQKRPAPHNLHRGESTIVRKITPVSLGPQLIVKRPVTGCGPAVLVNRPNPANNKRNQALVNEIIDIGVDLEQEGASRAIGLRLLKVVQRVFEETK